MIDLIVPGKPVRIYTVGTIVNSEKGVETGRWTSKNGSYGVIVMATEHGNVLVRPTDPGNYGAFVFSKEELEYLEDTPLPPATPLVPTPRRGRKPRRKRKIYLSEDDE
jgi:hypothetical protein